MVGIRTVLIVDDDPQILGLVQKMLGPRKVNVLVAPRPSAALRICEEQKVDLLIADMSLPEMVATVAERILKLQPGASVLLISGHYKDAPPRLSHVPFFESRSSPHN